MNSCDGVGAARVSMTGEIDVTDLYEYPDKVGCRPHTTTPWGGLVGEESRVPYRRKRCCEP
jgi:hypothetical protein